VASPCLEDDPAYPLASRYLTKDSVGLVSLGSWGGVPPRRRSSTACGFSPISQTWGTRRAWLSPCEHSHTHTQRGAGSGQAAPPSSAALDRSRHIDDILEDIERGLAARINESMGQIFFFTFSLDDTSHHGAAVAD
jgi:hypothetical protein